jgi:hypothetical protein
MNKKQAGLKSKEQTKQIGMASMRTFKIQTKNVLLFKDLHPSYPMFTSQVRRAACTKLHSKFK